MPGAALTSLVDDLAARLVEPTDAVWRDQADGPGARG
jgi:hypothetical protein